MAKKRRKPAPDTEVVSLRIPCDLVQRIDVVAAAEDRSRNNAAVRLLRSALDASTRAAG